MFCRCRYRHHFIRVDEARSRCAQRLQQTSLAVPQIPVINNIDVTVQTEAQAIRDALYRQAFGPVRWVECVQAIQARGIIHLVEVVRQGARGPDPAH